MKRHELEIKYCSLLSNCSEYRQYKNIQRYLYNRKPVCRTGRHAHAKLFLNCIDKFIDYSSWTINLLLDILVCSIALYLYSLLVIWLVIIQRYYAPKHLITSINQIAEKSAWSFAEIVFFESFSCSITFGATKQFEKLKLDLSTQMDLSPSTMKSVFC